MNRKDTKEYSLKNYTSFQKSKNEVISDSLQLNQNKGFYIVDIKYSVRDLSCDLISYGALKVRYG